MTDPSTLEPRALDARVAEVVFGLNPWVPKRCPHTGAEHHEDKVLAPGIPYCSTSWDGFGQLLDRMDRLGFQWSITYGRFGLLKERAHSARFLRGESDGQYPADIDEAKDEPSLPRAACIAAVRAVEGGIRG